MLILGIEVLISGNEVGYKIGNPTNIEMKSEPDSLSTSTSTSTVTAAHYQSEYIDVPIAFRSIYITVIYINLYYQFKKLSLRYLCHKIQDLFYLQQMVQPELVLQIITLLLIYLLRQLRR